MGGNGREQWARPLATLVSDLRCEETCPRREEGVVVEGLGLFTDEEGKEGAPYITRE